MNPGKINPCVEFLQHLIDAMAISNDTPVLSWGTVFSFATSAVGDAAKRSKLYHSCNIMAAMYGYSYEKAIQIAFEQNPALREQWEDKFTLEPVPAKSEPISQSK